MVFTLQHHSVTLWKTAPYLDLDVQSKSEFRQVVIEMVPSHREILAQRGRLVGWIGQGKLV